MTDADDPFLGSDYVLIFASRDDIQAGDIQPILGPLNALLRQDVASRMRHKVRFGVNGYDDDPRALYDIPEVQSWMRKLDQEWPYWFFFLSPGEHSTLGWITGTLVPFVKLRHGFRFDDPVAFGQFTEVHFAAMNQICEFLGDSGDTIRRMSDAVVAFYVSRGK